jgi:hypothetical protein
VGQGDQSQVLLEVYPFNADLDSPLAYEQATSLKPEGKSSHLNLSLNRLFERLRGQTKSPACSC